MYSPRRSFSSALRARSQPGDLHARRDQVPDAHQQLLVACVQEQVTVARLDQDGLAVDEIGGCPLDLAARGGKHGVATVADERDALQAAAAEHPSLEWRARARVGPPH